MATIESICKKYKNDIKGYDVVVVSTINTDTKAVGYGYLFRDPHSGSIAISYSANYCHLVYPESKDFKFVEILHITDKKLKDFYNL